MEIALDIKTEDMVERMSNAAIATAQQHFLPRKILHVFGRMQHGGAELRTLDLMRCLDRSRYQLSFCTLSGLPGALDDEIRALGGEVYPCRLGWSFARRFCALLQRERFDAVHSHVHYASGYIVRLAAKASIPQRIVHFRSTSDDHEGSFRRHVQRWVLQQWIDAYATHILAVSEGTMTTVWGPRWQSDRRCRVIYNGIDLSRLVVKAACHSVREEFAIPPGSPLYLHIGNLRKAKNHERLLAIFVAIRQRTPHARLLLVGAGDEQSTMSLRVRAIQLGIAEAVTFVGRRTDVARFLVAADVLLFPSLWEGLPGVVLEAVAVGTPVLASDLPGIKEIAARLPLVSCCSLSANDEEWALLAEQLSASPRTREGRERAQQTLARSEFNMTHCLSLQIQVWDEAPLVC